MLSTASKITQLLKSLGSDFAKVEFIEFLPDTGFGEAGYMLHLKTGIRSILWLMTLHALYLHLTCLRLIT
jgi:hypothetical protein